MFIQAGSGRLTLKRGKQSSADALKALHVAGWRDDLSESLAIYGYLALLQAKDQNGANALLKDAITYGDRKVAYPVLQYFNHDLSSAQLLDSAKKNHLTEAVCFTGCDLLWRGQKAEAKPYFQQVRRDGDSSLLEYKLAMALLFKPKERPQEQQHPIEKKLAVVIGISKFKDPAITLKYAAKDATDFYNYLITDGHFAKENVKLLLDEEATRENVLSVLGDKWLPRQANPDDLVVVYISTHGSASSFDIGGINYLVAYNTDKDNLYATGIPLQDLARIIKRVPAEREILMLDACHSGAAVLDGSKGFMFKGGLDAGALAKASEQLVMCSSQTDELSWESKQYPNGFTHHLIIGLSANGGRSKLMDAFTYVKRHVDDEVSKDRHSHQNPVLKTNWSAADLMIGVPATASVSVAK